MKTDGTRKAHVARSQLGTALHLYLEGLDPVSVHVLACGGLEVAEGLAEQAQATPFRDFALDVHPDMAVRDLVKIRNAAWNAMKHAKNRAGAPRDDEELLGGRWSNDNEALMMEGWFNLGQAGIPLPIEAQVFQLWMLAQHAQQDQVGASVFELFPDLSGLSTEQRREALKEAIKVARGETEVMASAQTDPRPLILKH